MARLTRALDARSGYSAPIWERSSRDLAQFGCRSEADSCKQPPVPSYSVLAAKSARCGHRL
eukprot:803489-Alexandrium_andersonii.AAC.1